MKYERRSLKGYRAKILRPKPMTSGKDRGKAKDIVRDIARYCKFKILKDLGCNIYEKKDPLPRKNYLIMQQSCFKSSELRGTEEKSLEAENSAL